MREHKHCPPYLRSGPGEREQLAIVCHCVLVDSLGEKSDMDNVQDPDERSEEAGLINLISTRTIAPRPTGMLASEAAYYWQPQGRTY